MGEKPKKPSANVNWSDPSGLAGFIAGEDKVVIVYFDYYSFSISRQIYETRSLLKHFTLHPVVAVGNS